MQVPFPTTAQDEGTKNQHSLALLSALPSLMRQQSHSDSLASVYSSVHVVSKASAMFSKSVLHSVHSTEVTELQRGSVHIQYFSGHPLILKDLDSHFRL